MSDWEIKNNPYLQQIDNTYYSVNPYRYPAASGNGSVYNSVFTADNETTKISEP